MDFGDIIYVVLAIVFSAAGALGKRKKKSSQQRKSSTAKQIFEELFSEEKVDDPVQQVYFEEELEDEAITDETETYERVEYTPVNFTPSVETREKVITETIRSNKATHQQHPLLSDIRKKSEIQKAVLYAEILKPKF